MKGSSVSPTTRTSTSRASKVGPGNTRANSSGGKGRSQTDASDRSHPEKAAAHRAVAHNSSVFRLPVVGEVTLPPASHLGWYAGVGVLVALEILEWPVAVVLAAGKALADNQHNRVLEDFGEALDEAG